MRFSNPANGYVENVRAPFLGALFGGPFYFVLKGVWRHVVLYFSVLSFLTTGWLGIVGFTAVAAGPALIGYLNSSASIPPSIVAATAILVVAAVAPFLIYPFLAAGIVRRHFLRLGWVEIDRDGDQIAP
jgi:hypothetical protein